MVSEFGKALRKLRIDMDTPQKDMASAVGITPTYLWAIESGKVRIPGYFIPKIQDYYNLTDAQRLDLESLVVQPIFSPSSAKIKRNLHDDGTCLAGLRKKFHTLDADQVKAIQKIIA